MNIIWKRFKQYLYKMKYFYIAFILLGSIFKLYPQVDLFISDKFYKLDEGFFLEYNPIMMFVYYGVNYATVGLIVIFLLLYSYNLIFKKCILNFNNKGITFLILSLAAGPGLVTNAILKEHIGRPRPDTIIDFGGNHLFVPPFTISNACDTNCSFVSGHASFGFFLMSIGLLYLGTKRKIFISFGFIAGWLIGLVRIIQGRHFFTDVLFAFFFVWAITSLIYALMYGFNEDNKNV